VVRDRSEIPTWTAFSKFSPQYRFPSRLGKTKFLPEYPITFESTEKAVTKEDIFAGLPVSFNSCSGGQANSVNYPILSTGGYIFDEITVSFQNLAEDNFRPQILDAYRELCSDPHSSFNGAKDILEAIWLPLSLHDEHFEPQEQYAQRTLSFIICFSRWVMAMFFMKRDPLHRKEKPYAYRYAAAIDIPQSNFALEERDHITIKDIRSHLPDFSIERNGFAVLKMTDEIPYSDYFDTLKVEVYFRQLESILQSHLQASHVHVFRHAVSFRVSLPQRQENYGEARQRLTKKADP